MGNVTDIPQYKLERLAEVLYPEMKQFLMSSEGKREFSIWEKQQMSDIGIKTQKKA